MLDSLLEYRRQAPVFQERCREPTMIDAKALPFQRQQLSHG